MGTAMTDGLVAALARAQAKFPGVPKSRTAKVQMKAGGTYSYTYADLADVLAAVRPVLAAEGIALVQSTDDTDTGVVLVTRLLHGDDVIEGRYPLHVGGSSPQEVGSLLTYFRRYTITALLGISAQDDDDGQQAQQSHRAPEVPTTNLAGSKVVAALDPYVAAAGSPPEKPIAAMTMAELIAYGRQIGVVMSGSKADFVRTLEPYVLAATGAEPWDTAPVDGEGERSGEPAAQSAVQSPPSRREPDAIPFEPVVAKPTAERLLPPDARKSVRSQ